MIALGLKHWGNKRREFLPFSGHTSSPIAAIISRQKIYVWNFRVNLHDLTNLSELSTLPKISDPQPFADGKL
jgi:hypothetical protein